MFATMPHRGNEPPPEFILPIIVIVMIVIFVITLLMAVPKLVAGLRPTERKKLGEGVGALLVACVMSCMNFPLGTAVGVYGLIFILGDAGKASLLEPSQGPKITSHRRPLIVGNSNNSSL